MNKFNESADSKVRPPVAPDRERPDHLAIALPLIFMLAAVTILSVNQVPCNDVALRYAPMAEAFANGQYDLAFHPRFGVLFTVLSGTAVFITHLDGFRCCQLASLLLFTLAAYPLYGIFKLLFDRATAVKGMALYLVCSHLLRIPLEGLRDSGKTLGFALAVYGIIHLYKSSQQTAGYLWAGCGAAILTMTRGDGAATAAMLLTIMLIFDITRYRWRFYRSALAGMLFLLLIMPQTLYVWSLTGYPVPDIRHAQILKKLAIPPLTTPELELP